MTLRSRRSLLRTVGATALSASLAGCSALDSGSEGVVLGDVVVRNANAESRTVRVELVRDEEPVYEGTVTVDGASDGVGAVSVVDATWPSTPSTYELTYVVRESETLDVRSERLTADSVGPNHDCAVPTITMGYPRESTVDFAVLGGDAGTKRYCPGAAESTQTTSERNSQDSTTSPS
jgi:hypothetical protein